jgi:hypothetical protein
MTLIPAPRPSSPRRSLLAALALAALLALPAAAHGAEAGEQATWQLEQPTPPPAPPGVPPAPVAVGLGLIGDVEFWEPAAGAPQADRGLLITGGNGTAVPPGVWAYNGVRWHEVADVCGATNGRVAWSGPEEFWTVSDGRPGQSAKNAGTGFEEEAPLQDNTLCRFAGGQVADSYAHLAFQADSYRAMDAAACVPPRPPAASSRECWFGGALPPANETGGSFHLHWNGSSLEEQPDPEAHAVTDMRQFEGAIYESVAVTATDPEGVLKLGPPPVLHLIEGGVVEPESSLPLYGPAEPAMALEGLRLSNAGEDLWAAAGASNQSLSPEQESGQVTVLERSEGLWRQIFGPRHPLPEVFSSQAEAEALTGAGSASSAPVSAFAAEPGGQDAWIALAPREGRQGRDAVLVHIDAAGEVLGVQELPSAEERAHGIGPKGAAVRIACPAVDDCWMATSEGWLYHLATAAARAAAASGAGRSEMSAFPEGLIISERPRDQGLPQEVVEAPPADTSGVNEERHSEEGTFQPAKEGTGTPKVSLPLLSRLKDRLRNGYVLELSFHLSVRARVQLIAKRRGRVVARTARRTFRAGNHSLSLRLNPRAWPTKLSLQTKALAPLKEVSSVTGEGANITTETTRLQLLPRVTWLGGLDRFP